MQDDGGSGLISNFSFTLVYLRLAGDAQSEQQYWRWVRGKRSELLGSLVKPLGAYSPGYKP